MEFYVGDNYIHITPKNIHIHDSYKVKTAKRMLFVIDYILAVDSSILKTRTRKSILREWKAHNVLYKLHIFRKSTAHTDIEANQSLFHKIGYLLLSVLAV